MQFQSFTMQNRNKELISFNHKKNEIEVSLFLPTLQLIVSIKT